MTDTRGPFRHAPNEPKDFLAEMQGRTGTMRQQPPARLLLPTLAPTLRRNER
jgi:hypothetical protein